MKRNDKKQQHIQINIILKWLNVDDFNFFKQKQRFKQYATGGKHGRGQRE